MFQPHLDPELHREPVREERGQKKEKSNRSAALSKTQEHAVLGIAVGMGERQRQRENDEREINRSKRFLRTAL